MSQDLFPQTEAFMTLDQIESVQMDHNSTCNLKCPQCARILHGEVNPELEMKELSLEFYKNVFSPDFCKQLKFILFCGNYGDAVASTNIKEVASYLKDAGLKAITIFTNGSLRSASWWTEFAKILDRPGDKVCFSIDGLADTNSLYRRGSHFNKIIENAQAFIQAGGRARWDYLVFKHNEHQVDEAKALAKNLGFFQFKVKKTNRFIQEKSYLSGKASIDDKIYHKTAGAKEEAGVIEVPTQSHYKTKSFLQFENLVNKYESWFDYIDATPIRCKAMETKSIFIDFDGKVWPCTWIAAPLHFHKEKNTQKEQLEKIVKKHGQEFNSLHSYSLREILAHPWLGGELRKSWSSKMNDKNSKLMTCGRTCGAEYDFSSNSEQNREVTEFVS